MWYPRPQSEQIFDALGEEHAAQEIISTDNGDPGEDGRSVKSSLEPSFEASSGILMTDCNNSNKWVD